MALTENNASAYAKVWSDKQRAVWYVVVFSGAELESWRNTILAIHSPFNGLPIQNLVVSLIS